MTGSGNRRGETGLWMAAAAEVEVDSPPPSPLFKEGTSGHIVSQLLS